MRTLQFSRATTHRRFLLGAALSATTALSACGSGDSGHPSGMIVDDYKPDAAATPDAQFVTDVTHVPLADGSGDSGTDAGSEAAPEASMQEADAPEPPLCAADGGPVRPDQPTAPEQAAGVCGATLHRAATTSVKEGASIQFVGLTPDLRT